MSDIKQATFRLNKETTDKFKQYCEENNLTAAQGFDFLMEILTLDNAKATLTTRETEISNFEQHTKALISAYLHSLELNENAEARIKEQFATQIETQARSIAEYQGEITELKHRLEEALSLAEGYQAEFSTLQLTINDIEEKRNRAETDLAVLKEEKETQLRDKESIITMLSAKLTGAEDKANEYDALKEQINALQADLSQALQTIKDNEKDAQITQERAVRTAEKNLEAEHRKELDRLRSQNTELLQTIAGIEKTTAEQLRTVEKENATLREKLASYKRNKITNQNSTSELKIY